MSSFVGIAPSNNIIGRTRQQIGCRLPRPMQRVLLSEAEVDVLRYGALKDPLSEQWEQRWLAANKEAGNGEWHHTPHLAEFIDHPVGASPTHRVMLFAMPAGVMFEDVAQLLPQLRSHLGERWLTVEPWEQSKVLLPNDDEAAAIPRRDALLHSVAFVVSHALAPSDKWGESPHLDGETPLGFARFAARCVVLDAFRELGLGTPLELSQERVLSDEGARLSWRTYWISTEAEVDKVITAHMSLDEALGCEVFQAFRTGTRGFCLIFGHAGVADGDDASD